MKYQPQWIDAVYNVLAHKKSNMQLAVEVRLSYECPLVRSAKAVDLIADSWKAMKPILSFALDE